MISRLRAAEHRTRHAGVIMLKICTRRSISALLAACLAQNLERSTSLAPSAILGPLHVHGRDRRVAGVLTVHVDLEASASQKRLILRQALTAAHVL